ncbi:MAG: 30S ribosome-binding factor RbfA [Bacilli bacterium]|jgi:ribosome-binding factor A|nr:30S ribosome-binding factor RbfA [Bacilli bacterium]HOF53759.1 30S ribosome-binding factor RbfA [Bacilli bacterium]HOR20685.1 30S ribosome-binding factor RbfA [Bacilli bacterium]HPK67680.1 30S ribosome-binding factor RbfA [Bacilli bacterium]
MANRTERIQSIIAKNISEILQFEVKNKSVGLVSVTEVRVSSDFSYAKVYVSFIGAKHPNVNLEALNAAKGFVRSSLASKLDIRKVPEISFILDDTFEKRDRIEKILKEEAETLNKLRGK